MRASGAQVLMAALERAGVETVFGHPGGAILPGYEALRDAGLRHVLARHEQGAGHMAEGYAKAGGGLGVVLTTSGPGATNLVTPLTDAFMDSVPLLAITGQVGTSGIGREAFQEADVVSLTAPVTKHNESVTDGDRIAGAVAEAVHVATSGRPGPVLLDIPKDVLAGPAELRWPGEVAVAGYAPARDCDPAAVRAAADALLEASRPVVYAGGGVLAARATPALRRLVEVLRLPVVTTLMAQGAFPDGHPCHLGMPGMHGHWTATTAMQRSDLLLGLGTRFDDRVTGALDGFAPDATVVHVDIDPVEVGKRRHADIGAVADCRAFLEALLDELARRAPAGERLGPWWRQLRAWQEAHPLRWEQPDGGLPKPQTVLRALGERLDDADVVVTGVGQHQMWAAQLLDRREPGTWITSGGLGTMGFGLPAAIGARAARPASRVLLVDGDGGFQMTLQELATAAAEGLPVVCCVLNNGGLGMVRQWQHLFHGGPSACDLSPDLPSLEVLAQAYGCAGLRCDDLDDLDATLDKALAIDDVPVLVDLRVDPDEQVYPMVPQGASNDGLVESAAELAR